MLFYILNKYKFLFEVTLGNWNTKPVDIEIQPGSKPHHTKIYPVHQAHKEVFFKGSITVVPTRGIGQSGEPLLLFN